MTEIDSSCAVEPFYHSPSTICEVDLSAENACKRRKVRRLLKLASFMERV